MTEPLFIHFTEHNDNEDKTWHSWLQVDGNEAELDKLRTLLTEAKAASEDDFDDFPYELGETEPESVVDILVKYAENGYMASHCKVVGVFICPDDVGDEVDEVLYKDGITDFFKTDFFKPVSS